MGPFRAPAPPQKKRTHTHTHAHTHTCAHTRTLTEMRKCYNGNLTFCAGLDAKRLGQAGTVMEKCMWKMDRRVLMDKGFGQT